MINQDQLTEIWVQDISGRYNADPILVEKVIRAFLLLEGLVKQNLDFVFKGGTALMLHFDSSKRLSIDIDIILPDKTADLENILTSLVNVQDFIRWEMQERTARSDIEKAHYKLYFKPLHKTGKDEEYVLLDILFEDIHYANLIELPITSFFVPDAGKPIHVQVPTVEDLLGDKLTAFAPNTTGIPYFKGKDRMSMEIIKQLYDVGNLFDVAEDLRTVKDTFHKFAVAELSYRNTDGLTAEDVLEDIFQTSLSIATIGKSGGANIVELQQGIKRVRSFIHSEKYQLKKAIIHAAKAAYLATILKHDADTLERFKPGINMEDWIIEQPFNTRVNKLKKSDPEAFFYWYKMYKMSKS
ncbi:MAG: nucleotidyl transferase AbiEii/AbiGii toxin family protein [Candidatus Paceibacterota bacterium]